MLRRATARDAETISHITRLAYAKWVPLLGRKPRPMTVDYKEALRHHIIDLFETHGEVKALIEMVVREGYLLIENIAVLPAHQGKRIGDLLLRHAENLARSKGLGELQLYTNTLFAANIKYYERRGYREFGREELAVGGALVHMRKAVKL